MSIEPNYCTLYHFCEEGMLNHHKTDPTTLIQSLHVGSPFYPRIGKYGAMQLIVDFIAPTLDKEDFYYKMEITTCAGPCCMSYNVYMEKLACMDQFGFVIEEG